MGRKEKLGCGDCGALVLGRECYAIQGAIFEVYRTMGAGFLEAVYQECLEQELALRGIPFQPQVELKLTYKNNPLRQTYRADFVCYSSILLELKACRAFEPIHRAQVLNYLKATGFHLGLLVNFGAGPQAVIERFVF